MVQPLIQAIWILIDHKIFPEDIPFDNVALFQGEYLS